MLLPHLLPHLIYQFKSETELIGSIQKLSSNFTTNRDNLDEYLNSEKLVSAYTAFYLTTNIPKWKQVLAKLELEENAFNELEMVDIGCGPGTFMIAQLENNPHQTCYGVETSDVMRKQAKCLLENFYPNAKANIFSRTSEVPKKEKTRLGVFGHSANEMEINQVIQIIDKLELDKILFIEPGTKSYFEKALEIRSKLIEKSFNISYPCPSSTTCPMSGMDDWCHQFLYIKQELEIERICQIVKKDRKLLPQIIHYFEKDAIKSTKKINRVIRVYKPTKFGIELQICHLKDSENKLFDLQQLFRRKSKKEMKRLQAILAGERITFTPIKELEKNMVRGDIELLN